MKPLGYYVQRSSGLFPAPLPQDSPLMDRIVKIFRFLGIFLAKVLQDNRLVDLPLSMPFLKLMCHGEVKQNIRPRLSLPSSRMSMSSISGCGGDDDIMMSSTHTEYENDKELLFDPPKHYDEELPWFNGILGVEDWALVRPHHGKFLSTLKNVIMLKQKVMNDASLQEEDRNNQLQNLTFTFSDEQHCPVKIEDLG